MSSEIQKSLDPQWIGGLHDGIPVEMEYFLFRIFTESGSYAHMFVEKSGIDENWNLKKLPEGFVSAVMISRKG